MLTLQVLLLLGKLSWDVFCFIIPIVLVFAVLPLPTCSPSARLLLTWVQRKSDHLAMGGEIRIMVAGGWRDPRQSEEQKNAAVGGCGGEGESEAEN